MASSIPVATVPVFAIFSIFLARFATTTTAAIGWRRIAVICPSGRDGGHILWVPSLVMPSRGRGGCPGRWGAARCPRFRRGRNRSINDWMCRFRIGGFEHIDREAKEKGNQ